MSPYVNAAEQLVTEILVSDIRRSTSFYRQLGFELLRDAGDFVELTWETHHLFLAERSTLGDLAGAALPGPSPSFPVANVRVMVPDVDSCWRDATAIGARIVSPIADRGYGLRDFTLTDPDGFGIRFATVLATEAGKDASPSTAPEAASTRIHLLAISGSLRAASSNSRAVRALVRLAPQGVAVSIYDGLGALPAFNPDLEDARLGPVDDFRERLRAADGVVISSPEYAHGVPGALKNALDWVVGSGELVGKPVVLVNVSPLSTYAHLSLRETLAVMSTRLLDDPSPPFPTDAKKLDEAGMSSVPEVAAALRGALVALARAAAAPTDESATDTEKTKPP